MVDEILFKGLSVETGEWVYGYFVHDITSGKSFIYSTEINEAWVEGDYSFKAVEIVDEHVRQYTGFLDVSGKKIFIGDTCYFEEDGENHYFEVCWNGTYGKLMAEFGDDYPLDFREAYTGCVLVGE